MTIYTFDNLYNTLINVINGIGTVGLLVLIFFIAKHFISKVIAYRKNHTEFPKRLVAVFAISILVPLIGAIGLGLLFVESVTYDSRMKDSYIEYIGNPIVLICEEEYYRNSFIGYKVELQIGDQIIAPSNAFPSETITHLQNDEEIIIHYGIIENDGLYVWSIKTVQK